MRPARLFWVLAAVLLPVSLAGPAVLRRVLLEREKALFDNAVWRAVEAAERGDVRTARRETALALVPPLERTELWDDARRFGLLPGVVESRLALARSLTARGLLEEARLAAWAAVRAYHAEPRPSLDPRAWRLIHDASPESSAQRAAAARVLALLGAVPASEAEDDVAANEEPRGRQALVLRRLEPVSNGYARAGALRRRGPALEVELRAVEAAAQPVALEAPAAALRVRARGHALLGLPPILLVSFDGLEPYPLVLANGDTRELSVPASLAAGEHTLRLELLNGFRLRNGDERYVELSAIHIESR